MERRPNDSAVSVGLEDYMETFKDPPYSPTTMQPPNAESPAPLTEEQRAAQEQETLESFAQASTAIAVDSPPANDDFDDDGYETDNAESVTTSITSSVRDFQFENGRRYHKFREGSYFFPNDASEQDREDLKHAMMINLLQKHHFAPIGDNPQEILDLGTGTGIWVIEMGDQFPGATIRGIDLSPIQPEWVPPNVKFVVDDFESPWLYDENFFDYIHTRHTVMAVRDWDQLYSQAFKHLKPGAWIESQEIVHLPHCSDGSMPTNWAIAEYWDLIHTALAKGNVNFASAPLLAQKMTAAGFTNVTQQILHVPIGPWARNRLLKLVGLYWRTVLYDGASPIALRPLTRELGWTMQEVEVWLVEVRKAYMDESVHAFMPLYLIQGQKPLDGMPASSWDTDMQQPTFNFQPPSQPVQSSIPQTPNHQAAVPNSLPNQAAAPIPNHEQPQFQPPTGFQQPSTQSTLQQSDDSNTRSNSTSLFTQTTQSTSGFDTKATVPQQFVPVQVHPPSREQSEVYPPNPELPSTSTSNPLKHPRHDEEDTDAIL